VTRPALLALALTVLAVAARAETTLKPTCERLLTARVVALDQSIYMNRLGTVLPIGMIFALERDVVPLDPARGLAPGNVQLRPDKRPRPLVLRMNEGDCLRIELRNLLRPERRPAAAPATRTASLHVMGLEPVTGMRDDGSFAGANPSGLVAPGESATYTLYAPHEGTYYLASAAGDVGGREAGNGGQTAAGLFGAVNVEPRGSVWYRSQVTREELGYATVGHTADGHPILDYGAVYPPGHRRSGAPVLRLLGPPAVPGGAGEIVGSDLTALVVGREGREAFREITVLYHEAFTVEQPFPEEYGNATLTATLNSGSDAFALNYGTDGLGNRILANRLGVGPAAGCAECKYEEFYLSSWPNGDPALLVDQPAGAPLPSGERRGKGAPRATRAFFPDDPANVYHSYIGDPVRFRVLHGSSRVHHMHHIHGHQWLHAPGSDRSTFQDTQAVGPGSAFTLDMSRSGRGGAFRQVGDALFHCHIYSHVTRGMWALWRNHDVFEVGTELDAAGRPRPGARALPDGEIAAGTPIPAVVPLPNLPMPPLPAPVRLVDGGRRVEVLGPGNPGFPFFVPGVAGHRAPPPPLDLRHDGGLPRSVIVNDGADIATGVDAHVDRLDFSKRLTRIHALELPQAGTAVERAAMAAHGERDHASFRPDGLPGTFVLNGLPPAPGAPWSDPCRPGAPLRRYQAAAVETDVVLDKKGWHFPQERLTLLWSDVLPTLKGERAPQPFAFRADSGDCIELEHTNLVPPVYELNDFLVRTPTDILGQHIHLVSYDLLASDGAANGWNYEDGALSPAEVRERIAAINADGGLVTTNAEGGQINLEGGQINAEGLVNPDGATRRTLAPTPHPFFGAGPAGAWLGAQINVQRWYADPVLDRAGDDRTLRAVFTHDHFSPSTHQHAGLYGALLVEPAGSRWRDPESGAALYTRADGGPTSWRADILTPAPEESFREFLLMYQSLQPAYLPGGGRPPDPARAVNPPGVDAATGRCEDGQPLPCAQMASKPGAGTWTVNYRHEPLPWRVEGSDPKTAAGDLAHAFRSLPRADPDLNRQPSIYPPLTGGVAGTDPFTPLLRAYQGDRVKIRTIFGAYTFMNMFQVPGLSWLAEPADPNSGYRATQPLGLAEAAELSFRLPPASTPADHPFADYLYLPSAYSPGIVQGLWGLLRSYDGRQGRQPDLLPLPGNEPQAGAPGPFPSCPPEAPVRRFAVTATSAAQALPGGRLVYNARPGPLGPLADPQALLLVRGEDLDAAGRLRPGVPVEPLVLRAAAGECVEVELTNALDPRLPVFSQPTEAGDLPSHPRLSTSPTVGLHPQLLAYDATRDQGLNMGQNPVATVPPGGRRTYRWYAGLLVSGGVGEGGAPRHVPAELGAVNLLPADPLRQHPHGLFGALVVEPPGASWREDAGSRAAALVTPASGAPFREMVLLLQEEVEVKAGERSLTGRVRAVNYRSEPTFQRTGRDPDTPKGDPWEEDLTCLRSDRQVGEDPETPVVSVAAGTPLRLRLLNPGSAANDPQVFALHGHTWQEQPYADGSRRLGDNPRAEWKASQPGLGAGSAFDALIPKAGGTFGIAGDYLYRALASDHYDFGLWGILRVGPAGGQDGSPAPDVVTLTAIEAQSPGELRVAGTVTPLPATGGYAREVQLFGGGREEGRCVGPLLGRAAVDPASGRFHFAGALNDLPEGLCAASAGGGAVSLGLAEVARCTSSASPTTVAPGSSRP
jgi:manganese oxidase